MSKHNRWSKVKHQKGSTDVERGKIFTKLSKLITLAVQQKGPDSETNASLRAALEKARAARLPKENIDRAIQKGKGELKEGEKLEHVTYEGFGPSGIAFYIHALTNNRNRTSANIRTIFTKHGGSLASPGSVAWMFEKKGLIIIFPFETQNEELELKLIDAGADDIIFKSKTLSITTQKDCFEQVLNMVNTLPVQKSEITFIPKEIKKTVSQAEKEKNIELIKALEDDCDIDEVFYNLHINE